ncbi:MAG: alpha/beta fold hydrolase [Minisyncoccia bacterium]
MEHSIEIGGLKIFYHLAGDEHNPPLVFLHAWGAQSRLMPRVVREFAKNFYVLAPEHPGLLRSQTPRLSAWSFENYARLLDKFLDRMNI